MDEMDIPPSPAKRKRVTKACLVCAKSRRKCDGVQPFCGTCRTQGTECAWSDIPTRRGPPKGYRRGTADPTSLIPKIGKIREHIQALQVAYGERLVLDELHKALYNGRVCNTYDSSTPAAPSVASPSPIARASTIDGVKMSPTPGDITVKSEADAGSSMGSLPMTKARSERDWSETEQDDRSNTDVDEGSSSGLAFLATSIRYMHTDARGGAAPLTPVSDGGRLPMEKYSPWTPRDADRQPVVRRRSSAASTYMNYGQPQPSPAEVEILLKTYWTSIHPHWPILYKPSFDNISIFHIYEQVPLALLYSIYCLAARLAPTAALNAQAAENFRRMAEDQLMSDNTFDSDINTCTALFLLSLYYQGEGNQRRAWITCGLASMMALDLGLHKSAAHLPLVEHERRVRVFWNIFIYEKVIAAEMGRPVSIRMMHCDPTRLSEEQSDEFETVFHPASNLAVRLYIISHFNAAVDLFRIFERILTEVHTVMLPTSNRNARERLVQELDRELENWQRSLGPKSAYPRPDDRQPTRSLYMIHAWYHNALILLHRPLIPRFRAGQPFVSNWHHRKATEHANHLVDLLNQFAAGQEIDKLPPNDAYLIFSAAVLHVFNLTLHDKTYRDAARPRLEQCIEWLRGLAETWTSASQFKQLLDAFSQVASNTISQCHSLSPISSTGSSPVHSQHSAHNMSYQRQASVPYAAHPHAEHSHAEHVPDVSNSQSDALQHQYARETEQRFAAPQLFGLENYFWNDMQITSVAAQQMGGYYQHPPSHEVAAETSNGVYYSIVQALQDDGRTA